MISVNGASLTAIDPDHRLVVLARTLNATSMEAQLGLEQEADQWRRFGHTCLGQGLYRHHAIFKSQSDAAV